MAESLTSSIAQSGSLANAAAAHAPSAAQPLRIQVHDDAAPVTAIWTALEQERTSTVYQRMDWTRIALETLEGKAKPLLVAGRIADRPAFLLPLAIDPGLPAIVRWIGGSHVNFNMGLYSAEFLEMADEAHMRAIMDAIAAHAPVSAVLHLCCQPRQWRNHANPILLLPHQTSANSAFALNLEGGFDAVLARGNGKRKRKKFRQQTRECDSVGGHSLLIAQSEDDVSRLLEAFLEQKSKRLRTLGISNVFTEPGAREMLRRLALRSLDMDEPLLRLYGLEVGGQVRAVFGAGIHDRHLSGYFSSISQDELTAMSPGEMLLYLVVQHAASNGIESLDLGGGDERYKRSWCDRQMELVDVILPLGVAAWPFAEAMRLGAAVKRSVRQNPRSWAAIGHVRRLRARLLWGA